MNLFAPFKRLTEAAPPPPLRSVRLERRGEGTCWLSIPPEDFGHIYLWDYFQRDLMLSLLSGLFVMIHLDGFAPFELDDDTREACPYQSDGQGKTFLLAGEGLLRAVTEIINVHDEYWEYGELMNFSAFADPPDLDFPPETDVRSLAGFVVKLQPLGDDLGLQIDFNPAALPWETVCERVGQLAAGYRLTVE